jgi:geranylgeranyl reductase family protein
MDAYRKLDVVVVGAGPAGCAAAFDLARANLNVLLLDRRSFPRVKPCAGALTVKAIAALRFSIEPVVRAVITDLVNRLELARRVRFSWPRPISVMTVREELDAFVLEQTLRVGARFAKIGRITELLETRDSVTVATERDRFTARFLIGADGANSTVRRLSGASPPELGFAIEGQLAGSTDDDHSVRLDFGVVPRGFGWIFPKGDHVNAGLYTYDARFPLFIEQLRRYVQTSLSRADVSQIVGCPIGMGGWARKPRRGRIFLVGDAAGLCEPVLGEGIYYAIKSGQIAAASILAELTDGVAAWSVFRSKMRSLQDTLRVEATMAEAFYRNPGFSYLALTSPMMEYSLMKGYSLGVPLGKIPAAIPFLPFLPD